MLETSMEQMAGRFVEVMVTPENMEKAVALQPIDQRAVFGKMVMLFDGVAQELLASLGETRIPGVADLFVASMKGIAK
ncbi:hypothetical protein [Undibacterium sp. YM2]|uniref:hypothetical protein n=1 Tax=Undibacterium sp. YM2 TaxID=2058625 RepID=UPI00351BAB54